MHKLALLVVALIVSACNINTNKQYQSEIQGKELNGSKNAVYDLRIPDIRLEAFLNALKSHSSTSDSINMAKMIRYPLEVKIKDESFTVANENSFIAHYKFIFNEKILNAISKTSIENLRVDERGFIIKDEAIIFAWDKDTNDNKLYITYINN